MDAYGNKQPLRGTSPQPAKKASSKRGRRKPAKGRLRIGATDIELERVSLTCHTGASITLWWDPNRKGIFVLGAPHSEVSIVPQGPNALVLRVR